MNRPTAAVAMAAMVVATVATAVLVADDDPRPPTRPTATPTSTRIPNIDRSFVDDALAAADIGPRTIAVTLTEHVPDRPERRHTTGRFRTDGRGVFASEVAVTDRTALSAPAVVRTVTEHRIVAGQLFQRYDTTGPFVDAGPVPDAAALPAGLDAAVPFPLAEIRTRFAGAIPAGEDRYQLVFTSPPGPFSVEAGWADIDAAGRLVRLHVFGRHVFAARPAHFVLEVAVTYRLTDPIVTPARTVPPDRAATSPLQTHNAALGVVIRVRELGERYGLAPRALDAIEEALARLPADMRATGPEDADGDRVADTGVIEITSPTATVCIRLSADRARPERDVTAGRC